MSDVQPQPYLGLYMIVRDSADTIDALLESVLQAKLKNGSKVPAFSEFCFVDTGSVDRTKSKIEITVARLVDFHVNFPLVPKPSNLGNWEPNVYNFDHPTEGRIRIVLANFKWIDDFAAARNYAFGLGTAKWRMWLDSDDVLPNAQNLLPTLRATEAANPEINCIVMPYEYAPDDALQTKSRIMRWADGWKWEGEIHEDVKSDKTHGKKMSQWSDPCVLHRPKGGHNEKSLERNWSICTRVMEKASAEGDTYKMGLMAYYLGLYARHDKAHALAEQHFLQAADYLRGSNLACYGLVELARDFMEQGDFPTAIKIASQAISHAPELQDGWGTLGVALCEADQPSRAATVFDSTFRLPKNVLEATRDLLWNDALVPVYAAKAYLSQGRVDDAERLMRTIPGQYARQERVWMTYSRVQSDLFKAKGKAALKFLVDYLVWNNEPVKALEVIRKAAPSNVESDPELSRWGLGITDKMQQLNSWSDYVRVYTAETNEVFDRGEDEVQIIRDQGRAQLSLEWAKRLPKEGEPFKLYCIGLHGGWIEEDMMDANPRIHLVACDVNPNANTAIKRLSEKFPGRVSFHTVREHHYDWIPAGQEGTFDGVICFEVIEHVPDAIEMLRTINRLLKPGGTLLLSTPVAEYWVAPDATKRHHWHQHVRAYQPHQLWEDVQATGFEGDIYASDNRILHFCELKKAHPVSHLELMVCGFNKPEITVWIPSTPKGFDPSSFQDGHVGGSEEAVIHLSRHLRKLGANVTVYVNRKPDRAATPHVVDSVVWRDASEFDPQRVKGAVLVWRSPLHASLLKKANPKLRVLNWLHDVSYGQPPHIYAQADGTIVLSKFHAEAIERYDGFKGPFLFAANGIEPSEFTPEALGKAGTGPDEQGRYSPGGSRDPHRIIYASAPNRGLEELLDMWLDVRAAVPDASLDIYYGWGITRKMMRQNPSLDLAMRPLLARLEMKLQELKNHGVTYHGGVSAHELHKAYARSGIWAHPCGDFEEIYCISALKAQAAGAYPVVRDRGSLNEVVEYGRLIDHVNQWEEAFKFALIGELQQPIGESVRSRMIPWALTQSWERAARMFFEHCIAKPIEVTILADGYRAFDFRDMFLPSGDPLGGSEEAVVVLSEALAAEGAKVTVHSQGSPRPTVSPGGVRWEKVENFLNPSRIDDAVLVWRNPEIAEQIDASRSGPVMNWLMDPDYGENNPSEPDSINITLTESHAKTLGLGHAKVLPLPLDISELPPLSEQNDKGRHSEWVMYSVSPDRGLVDLLRMWPVVRESVPNAQLHIFYGYERMIAAAGRSPEYRKAFHVEEIVRLTDELKSKGVVYHGGVSRTELMAWHVRCGTWAYPNRDEVFIETFSMAAVKAVACGLTPVCFGTGALAEVVPREFQLEPSDRNRSLEVFGGQLVKVMLKAPPFTLRKAYADAWREKYESRAVARRFLKLFEELRAERDDEEYYSEDDDWRIKPGGGAPIRSVGMIAEPIVPQKETHDVQNQD